MNRLPDVANRLRVLAAFRDRLGDPSFVFGRWRGGDRLPDGSIQVPWYELSDGAQAFIAAAAGAGWVTPAADWVAWQRTPEAQRLLAGPTETIAAASVAQLEKLLTTFVRGERFADGTLEAAFASGRLLAIVRRAAELADQL